MFGNRGLEIKSPAQIDAMRVAGRLVGETLELLREAAVPGVTTRALDTLAETNIRDHGHAGRVAQLETHGIRVPVRCNQGGKGPPALELIAQYKPSVTLFVDDLPVHHASMAKHAPDVWRLHMIAEPEMAPNVPPARHAHARIDDWAAATDWILARFEEGMPAPRT